MNIRRKVLVVLVSIFLFSAGRLCAETTQTDVKLRLNESDRGPSGIPAFLEATGVGLEPHAVDSPEQARLLAKRAATIVAYHDLVVARNRLNPYLGEPRPPESDADGFIQGARVVETEYLTPGKVSVTVELPIRIKVIPKREKWLRRELPRASRESQTTGGPMEISREEWQELIKNRREQTKAKKEESETTKGTK